MNINLIIKIILVILFFSNSYAKAKEFEDFVLDRYQVWTSWEITFNSLSIVNGAAFSISSSTIKIIEDFTMKEKTALELGNTTFSQEKTKNFNYSAFEKNYPQGNTNLNIKENSKVELGNMILSSTNKGYRFTEIQVLDSNFILNSISYIKNGAEYFINILINNKIENKSKYSFEVREGINFEGDIANFNLKNAKFIVGGDVQFLSSDNPSNRQRSKSIFLDNSDFILKGNLFRNKAYKDNDLTTISLKKDSRLIAEPSDKGEHNFIIPANFDINIDNSEFSLGNIEALGNVEGSIKLSGDNTKFNIKDLTLTGSLSFSVTSFSYYPIKIAFINFNNPSIDPKVNYLSFDGVSGEEKYEIGTIKFGSHSTKYLMKVTNASVNIDKINFFGKEFKIEGSNKKNELLYINQIKIYNSDNLISISSINLKADSFTLRSFAHLNIDNSDVVIKNLYIDEGEMVANNSTLNFDNIKGNSNEISLDNSNMNVKNIDYGTSVSNAAGTIELKNNSTFNVDYISGNYSDITLNNSNLIINESLDNSRSKETNISLDSKSSFIVTKEGLFKNPDSITINNSGNFNILANNNLFKLVNETTGRSILNDVNIKEIENAGRIELNKGTIDIINNAGTSILNDVNIKEIENAGTSILNNVNISEVENAGTIEINKGTIDYINNLGKIIVKGENKIDKYTSSRNDEKISKGEESELVFEFTDTNPNPMLLIGKVNNEKLLEKISISIPKTSVLRLGKNNKYNLIKTEQGSVGIIAGEFEQTLNILPDWLISSSSIDYNNGVNDSAGETASINIQRLTNYTNLMQAVPEASENKDIMNIANTIDDTVFSDAYEITDALDDVVTSLDLGTKHDFDEKLFYEIHQGKVTNISASPSLYELANNISKLKPVNNEVYTLYSHFNTNFALDKLIQADRNKNKLFWLNANYGLSNLLDKDGVKGFKSNTYRLNGGLTVDWDNNFLSSLMVGFSSGKVTGNEKLYDSTVSSFLGGASSSYINDYFYFSLAGLANMSTFATNRYIDFLNNEYVSNPSTISLSNVSTMEMAGKIETGLSFGIFTTKLLASESMLQNSNYEESGSSASLSVKSDKVLITDLGLGIELGRKFEKQTRSYNSRVGRSLNARVGGISGRFNSGSEMNIYPKIGINVLNRSYKSPKTTMKFIGTSDDLYKEMSSSTYSGMIMQFYGELLIRGKGSDFKISYDGDMSSGNYMNHNISASLSFSL